MTIATFFDPFCILYSPIMPLIRILIADDHASVRTQISARLQREPQFDIVGVAENSQQTVERALETKPQIVLMDPMMHDGRGIETIREICSRLPATCVIALTAVADTLETMELRKAGARKILNKGIESQALVTILRDAGSLDSTNRISQGGFPE
jgi:two-component system nitrate/nitrite response regulator NarL